MIKVNNKIKQFFMTENSAYWINNKNKVFFWGDNFLNFNGLHKNYCQDSVVKSKIIHRLKYYRFEEITAGV